MNIVQFIGVVASLITIITVPIAIFRSVQNRKRNARKRIRSSRVEISAPDQFPDKHQKLKYIYVDTDGIGFLHDPNSQNYILINKQSLDNPLKVLIWIRELSKKKWFSKEICGDFIGANMTLFGWMDEYGYSLYNVLNDHKIVTRRLSKGKMKNFINYMNQEDENNNRKENDK